MEWWGGDGEPEKLWEIEEEDKSSTLTQWIVVVWFCYITYIYFASLFFIFLNKLYFSAVNGVVFVWRSSAESKFEN